MLLSDREFKITDMLKVWTEKWTTCKIRWVVLAERWELRNDQNAGNFITP